MTTTSRLLADANGQLEAELRRRIQSGVPLDRLEELHELIIDIGPPCWASHETVGGVHQFDGSVLRPPYQLLVPRGRNIRRIGHIIHTSDSIPIIDQEVKFGIPVIAPTRALNQIAATSTPGMRSHAAARAGWSASSFASSRAPASRDRTRRCTSATAGTG